MSARVMSGLRALAFALAIAVALPGAAAAGRIFKTYGDVMSYALPLTALAVTLAHGDGEGLAEFSAAMLFADSATRGLKRVVRRERPDGSDRLSFPSGHATRAFAAAAYLDRRYGRAFGFPAYMLAWTVGASRVDARAHHWSDVMGAAAITTFIVYLAAHGEDR